MPSYGKRTHSASVMNSFDELFNQNLDLARKEYFSSINAPSARRVNVATMNLDDVVDDYAILDTDTSGNESDISQIHHIVNSPISLTRKNNNNLKKDTVNNHEIHIHENNIKDGCITQRYKNCRNITNGNNTTKINNIININNNYDSTINCDNNKRNKISFYFVSDDNYASSSNDGRCHNTIKVENSRYVNRCKSNSYVHTNRPKKANHPNSTKKMIYSSDQFPNKRKKVKNSSRGRHLVCLEQNKIQQMRKKNLKKKSASNLLIDLLLGRTSTALKKIQLEIWRNSSQCNSKPPRICNWIQIGKSDLRTRHQIIQRHIIDLCASEANPSLKPVLNDCPKLMGKVDDHLKDIVKHLLAMGANPEISDADGNTPLFLALQYQKGEELLQLFLKADASFICELPRSVSQVGSLVDLAILFRQHEIVKLFLENGAIPMGSPSLAGIELVQFAKAYGFFDLAIQVLKSHFWKAIEEDDEKVLIRILQHGASIQIANIKDIEGRTPLYFAVQKDSPASLIRMLLHGSSDPNSLDNSRTPLTVFPLLRYRKNSLDVLELLLDGGANPHARVPLYSHLTESLSDYNAHREKNILPTIWKNHQQIRKQAKRYGRQMKRIKSKSLNPANSQPHLTLLSFAKQMALRTEAVTIIERAANLHVFGFQEHDL